MGFHLIFFHNPHSPSLQIQHCICQNGFVAQQLFARLVRINDLYGCIGVIEVIVDFFMTLFAALMKVT